MAAAAVELLQREREAALQALDQLSVLRLQVSDLLRSVAQLDRFSASAAHPDANGSAEAASADGWDEAPDLATAQQDVMEAWRELKIQLAQLVLDPVLEPSPAITRFQALSPLFPEMPILNPGSEPEAHAPHYPLPEERIGPAERLERVLEVQQRSAAVARRLDEHMARLLPNLGSARELGASATPTPPDSVVMVNRPRQGEAWQQQLEEEESRRQQLKKAMHDFCRTLLLAGLPEGVSIRAFFVSEPPVGLSLAPHIMVVVSSPCRWHLRLSMEPPPNSHAKLQFRDYRVTSATALAWGENVISAAAAEAVSSFHEFSADPSSRSALRHSIAVDSSSDQMQLDEDEQPEQSADCPPGLRAFVRWFARSYAEVFERPCVICGCLLQADPATAHCRGPLLPTHRCLVSGAPEHLRCRLRAQRPVFTGSKD